MRYWLTGVNELNNKWYHSGNPTFFCIPDNILESYYWGGDNMYESVNSNMLLEVLRLDEEDIIKSLI